MLLKIIKLIVNIGRLIVTLGITLVLLHFIITSQTKIVFVPFIICSLAMIGLSISHMIESRSLAVIFSKIFHSGFLIFWFGFLTFAMTICISTGNYLMILFSIPFWVIGMMLVMKLIKMK